MFTIDEIIDYFLTFLNIRKVKAMCDGCNKCEYNNIDNWKSYTFPCVFYLKTKKFYMLDPRMMNPQLCPNCCNNKLINADIKMLQYVTDDKCVSFENLFNLLYFKKLYSYIIFLMRHPKYKPKNVFVTTHYIIKLFNNRISQKDIELLTNMSYIKEVSYEDIERSSNMKSIKHHFDIRIKNNIPLIDYLE